MAKIAKTLSKKKPTIVNCAVTIAIVTVSVLASSGGILKDEGALDSTHVISFIGVTLGLSITITAMLLGVAEKLFSYLAADIRKIENSEPEKKEKLIGVTSSLESYFSHLRKALYTSFFSLTIAIAIAITSGLNLPDYLLPSPVNFELTIGEAILAIKLGLVILNLLLLFLVMRGLFYMIEATSIVILPKDRK